MPVTLKLVDDPSNPMVISLADYNTGRANFQAHYFLNNCNPTFGGQDLQIPWAAFYNAVNSFITSNSLDPATVALRFVYCYDNTAAALYLRMQLCTMTAVAGEAGTYSLVTTQCAWYTLDNGAVTPTQVTTQSDQSYFNYFYYCEAATCSAGASQELSADTSGTKYAKTVTFPWASEILAMYTDNGLTGNGYICFGACSYVNGGEGNSPILYPHGLVMYLEDANGKPLLDDNNEVVLFHNKGCDMGTLCPPECNVYIIP